jgi:hypothetical protein
MNGVIKEKQGLRADSIGVFLLGAAFLFMSISLVLLGGALYRQIMMRANENDEIRTTFAYISNQMHRADEFGGVEVGEFAGAQALLLNHDFYGWEFTTFLYYYDGALRELFVEKGFELDPDAGQVIIRLEDLGFSVDERGLITAWASFADGRREHVLLSPRSTAMEEAYR